MNCYVLTNWYDTSAKENWVEIYSPGSTLVDYFTVPYGCITICKDQINSCPEDYIDIIQKCVSAVTIPIGSNTELQGEQVELSRDELNALVTASKFTGTTRGGKRLNLNEADIQSIMTQKTCSVCGGSVSYKDHDTWAGWFCTPCNQGGHFKIKRK